ncbi:MAG: agmatinase [Planctomycetes bacterium]|nr:agmatinase [Planctomycetota bacterium]
MPENPPKGFLDIDPEYTEFNRARFVVLPIGYDGTATFMKGTRNGPDAILNASHHVDDFDEQLFGEFFHVGVYTHEHVVQGDESPEEAQEKIYQAAKPLVADDKIVISLGGEHSITPSLVRAVQEKWTDLSVLQFDAHLDLKNSFYGSVHNHACAMRRIYDLGADVISIGARSFDKWEYEFTQTHNLLFFPPEKIHADLDGVVKTVLDRLNDQVYISFDIDAIDPSQAPGTGTPEAGGIDYREALTLLEAVGRKKQIVGADIVEVAPIPGQVVTESLAARLAYKIIAYQQLYS